MPLTSSRWCKLACLIAALGAGTGSASAATLCSVSAGGLEFGSFAVITGLDAGADPNQDTTADIVVSCSGDPGTTAGVEVQLDGGGSGNPLARTLSSGSGVLAYNIYADTLHAQVWGDGTTASSRSVAIDLPALNPTGTATLTAYGRIPGGQRTAPVGSYSDTVVVTIIY